MKPTIVDFGIYQNSTNKHLVILNTQDYKILSSA